MLDNLSEYVYEVYRCQSVSAATKKLFVSQPALSIAIKKAEEELGFSIFNRKTVPFTLTPEGKVYIDAIEKIMKIESETKEAIQDISDFKRGTLRIGTATHLSFYAIPKICAAFRSKYPRIDISVISSNSTSLPSLLEKNTADLIFTSADDSIKKFKQDILFEEKFIIALRRDYCRAEHLLPYALSYDQIISRSYPPEKEIDTALFEGIEFVYSPPNTNIYKRRRAIFAGSKTEAYITSSAGSNLLNYNLMLSGFGALFTTDASIATMPSHNQCMYFALKNPEAKQSFCIAYPEHGNLLSSKIVYEFISTAKDLFNTENPLKTLSE